MRWWTVGAGVACLVATWSPAASAQNASASASAATEPPDTERRDAFTWSYPRFHTAEYAMTGVFGGLAIAGLLIPTPEPRWAEPTALDTAARSALRLGGRESRKTADDISDLTLTLGLNYAAFDATVVAWALRGRGSVAYQMTAINAEVIAVTAGLTGLTKTIIARQRPYARECVTDAVLRRTDECEPEAVNVSFISGHSSVAFAAASVTCMHHLNLDLYQDRVADTLACVGAYGAATTTGLLRILSDNHYATDVASGAAVGTLVGIGLPWLLHYRFDAEPAAVEQSAPRAQGSITLVPGPLAATVVGVF